MKNRSISLIGLLGIISTWICPQHLSAQTINSSNNKANPTTYEDDKIRVAIQDCSRNLQDLICQAVLTSKNSDRSIDLNGSTIRLVDSEGNEYYPSSFRLANRTSNNNSIKTELVENVPFKANFVFGKVPTSVNKIALLQIPLGGGINSTVKFRNLVVLDPNTPKTSQIAATTSKPAILSPSVSSDNSLICPDNTRILYRATSKNYLMYICGAKTPTHYVGHSKDGSEGITLRLRYFDRTRFSADNGDTNYTIAANRLTIRKDNKVIHQEKIEVLQSLPGVVTAAETAPTKPESKKVTTTVENSTTKTKPKTSPAVTTATQKVPTKPKAKKVTTTVENSTAKSKPKKAVPAQIKTQSNRQRLSGNQSTNSKPPIQSNKTNTVVTTTPKPKPTNK